MIGQDFLARARHEARRYGSDPWVFIRELLQNARDAGARSVTIEAGESSGRARILFADDGEGMTFDHARRYLFTLYASSKEHDRGAAGRFGVGFWSVLRFEPSRLVIRSWPRRGPAWEVELDGGLTEAATRTPPTRRGHGTEVVLERAAAEDGDLARRVHDAAWQSGRYLSRRADPRHPLEVRVNGVAVAAAFDLPAPSARFRKGKMRGVVALGPEARVELFAQGLRVRSASALEDLLSAEGSSELTRVRFPALGDGVAPQAILDGDDFEPLLARADVRDTPGLRRLVDLGQKELRNLIEKQIDAVRPRPLLARVGRPLAAASALLLAAAGGAWVARRNMPVATPSTITAALPTPMSVPSVLAVPGLAEETEAAGSPRLLAYRDLRDLYRGPRSDGFPSSAVPIGLGYEPSHRSLRFTAIALDRPFEPPPPPIDAGAYDGEPVLVDPVDVWLAIDDGPGLMRLPVPTGHRLDPTSVRLRSRVLPVHVSTAGEPLVELAQHEVGLLRYRTGRGAAPPVVQTSTVAPASLAPIAESLRSREPAAIVQEATAWVRERVAYSTSAQTVERHQIAAAAGQDLIAATLEIGAADCDVQNSVLATLLQASGVHARLAVGYVAEGGVALAPPHAWVEWREGGGPWRGADASGVAAYPRLPALRPRAAEPDLASAAERWLPWLGAAAVAITALAGVALSIFLIVRTHRNVRVAPGQDVAALLKGALQRPEAFREVPMVYRRPLVPKIDGRLVSLAEAWRLAADRRLFRSVRGSDLARRSSSGGATVLDGSRPEARAVADALGAVDLDEWDVFLRGVRRVRVLEAASARLRELGEPCELRAAPGIGAPAVLDLPAGGGVTRFLVLDAGERWLQAAETLFMRRPSEAVLVVADRLADVVRWDAAERSDVLKPLARDALREAQP